jgi:pimeloyl-ACP methyl ester carboxylesterase
VNDAGSRGVTGTREVRLADGRVVQTYDEGPEDAPLTIVWQHGSPQSGAPLPPLVAAARARGVRLLSYARPGYATSTVRPGRDVASAAADVAEVADAYAVARFAVMGASGGGPHALACGALLSQRVLAVACLAGIAPLTGAFDWWGGMRAPGGLQAAAEGRVARLAYAEHEEFDPESFTAADWAVLSAEWAPLGADAEAAGRAGPDGLVDDDVAYTTPWGFGLADVDVPALFVQGGEDRVVPAGHGSFQARSCPRGELWLRPRDGHIAVLRAVPVALDWLRDCAGGA